MKKSKMIYLPLLLPLLGVIFWSIYFSKGENKFEEMVSQFTNKKIDGIVLYSKEGTRGFFLIEIADKLSDSTLKYNVPKSWFFKENDIKIGDSVSKKSNSKIMTFYKVKNGVFEKCCDYEIGM